MTDLIPFDQSTEFGSIREYNQKGNESHPLDLKQSCGDSCS